MTLNRSLGLLFNNRPTEAEDIQAVKDATNEFANRVITPDTTKNAAERAIWIDECFDNDATLRPTVGQLIRTKQSDPTSIVAYFRDYFSQSIIPTLTIKNADFNVSKLGKNLYKNLAYVQFSSEEGEVTAEMSFIFRRQMSGKWLIAHLDSNVIYNKVPDELIAQGDIFKLWSLEAETGEITHEEVYIYPFNEINGIVKE
jgi:hypothetical protein